MTDRLKIELYTLELPLPRTYSTRVGPLHTSYVLVGRMRDEAGHVGAGYAWFNFADQLAECRTAVLALLEAAGDTLSAMLQIERIDEARFGVTLPKSKDAAHVLSSAAWDLLGHRNGRTCADMWGQVPGDNVHDYYATALFADRPLDLLLEDARALRAAQFRRAKMVPSSTVEETLHRLERVAEIFPEPGTIALDMGFGWTVPQTRALLAQSPVRIAWVEDPVPHDVIGELAAAGDTPVASGETCTELRELIDLHVDKGVQWIIIDVQHIGGPIRFMEAARILSALGARIGSHAFSQHSPHLLGCLKLTMPVENLAWWDRLFSPNFHADESGRVHLVGPGFGTELRMDMIESFGSSIR